MNIAFSTPVTSFGRCLPTGRRKLQRFEVSASYSRNGGHSGRATRPARKVEDLRDPAHLWSKYSLGTDVKEYGGVMSLEQYMRLPVEQYCVLDPELIKMIGENRFELKVPRLDIMNVWIEPLATVKVIQGESPPVVHLMTETCEIFGSDILQGLNLDGRFYMNFDAVLKWKSSTSKALPNGTGRGRIMADAKIDVWCEVEPPFNLMPKDILEATGNIPMEGLMRALLPLFLSNLRRDYEKWATSEKYRQERSAPTWSSLQSQST